MSNHKSSHPTRRSILKGLAGAGLMASSGVSVAANDRSTAITRENAKAGTTDWQLTYTRVDPSTRYRCPWIEGYVSHASIRAGDTLSLYVSTNPPAPFTVDFYRMGYYGGTGARHVKRLGPFDGGVQPDPEVGEKRVRECRWEACTTVEIPADWVSGVYLGKLSLLEGRYQSYVVFIVRDDRQADVLFQCSDNTWQAYNRWPDQYSLYDDGQSQWALKPDVHVSYDRPYGKYCQILDAPLSQGSGEFLLWEFPLAYWLEQAGCDVTYCSNTDVHADPSCLARTRSFISVGHDEYWSLEQFNHVKGAVDDGLNAAFFSGNTCCFGTPFSAASNGTPNRVITRAGRFGGLTELEKGKMGPFPVEGPNESSLISPRSQRD